MVCRKRNDITYDTPKLITAAMRNLWHTSNTAGLNDWRVSSPFMATMYFDTQTYDVLLGPSWFDGIVEKGR